MEATETLRTSLWQPHQLHRNSGLNSQSAISIYSARLSPPARSVICELVFQLTNHHLAYPGHQPSYTARLLSTFAVQPRKFCLMGDVVRGL